MSSSGFVPKSRDYAAIAKQYARDVVRGKIPACAWAKLACQRHLSDLTRSKSKAYPFTFDAAEAARVCGFIELLPHVKGAKAGTPLILEAWQVFMTAAIFGWVHKKTRLRRFRRVYIEVPRGNGKSAWLSGVGLYLTSADGEPGAEVYSGATTRDQARIVWGTAQQMVRKSPALRDELGVEALAHAIVQQESGSKFQAVSAEAGTLDGLNIHGGLIDELHAHKTRAVYDVFETATGKRRQSLLLVITTAGTNRQGICYEIRDGLLKVLKGTLEDEALFGIIYTIDDGDDWSDPKVWRKANPNWGVSVMPDIVEQLAKKAIATPSAQPNFQTKHLDVWVNADQAWMDMRHWDACGDDGRSLEAEHGEPCIIGVDLASKVDVSSVALLFPKPEGVYRLFMRHYVPRAKLDQAGPFDYQGWALQGRIEVTEGDVIDLDQIEADLLAFSERFTVREIAYDPWQATQMAQHLTANGATCVEYRPTVQNFSAAMKEVEALTRTRKLEHDACPVMGWMVSNVVCHVDAKDNVFPRKERAENKIDGPVALFMAMGRAIVNPDEGPSIYETQGLMTL